MKKSSLNIFYCTARQCEPIGQKFGECSILNPSFIGFREHLHVVIDQFRFFFQFCLCFSLVTISRQTSYDSGILRQDHGILRGCICHHQSANYGIRRQDYGIIRGLPMNRTRFADLVTMWVVHLPEWTETGGLQLPHRTRLYGPYFAAIAGCQIIVYINYGPSLRTY